MFENFSLWPPSASSISGPVDALYTTLLGITAFFSLLIASALLLFAIRYRRRPGLKATQIEGSLPLELVWTGIPFVIVVFVFAWGAQLYVEGQTPPRAGMRFSVTGKQWMWKIQHPTGQSEINSLHVPVGTDVDTLELEQPVTVMPLRWCGKCASCLAGHQHICQHLDFIDLLDGELADLRVLVGARHAGEDLGVVRGQRPDRLHADLDVGVAVLGTEDVDKTHVIAPAERSSMPRGRSANLEDGGARGQAARGVSRSPL